MPTVNVTLEDILRARDGRANAQRRLLHSHRLPLVSFTMNIAGPVKSAPLIELAFDAGLEALYAALGQPEAAEVIRPTTGCEALLVYDRPAAALKDACLALETAAPIGRLYDLDVLDMDGGKLSRPVPRTCLICGGDDLFPQPRPRAGRHRGPHQRNSGGFRRRISGRSGGGGVGAGGPPDPQAGAGGRAQ